MPPLTPTTAGRSNSPDSGEPLSVADQTPAVLLPTHSSTVKPPSFHSYKTSTPKPAPAPPAAAPVSRSPSVASSKLPPNLSATPRRTASVNHHLRRPKPTVKLPHILSESSEASYSPRENQVTPPSEHRLLHGGLGVPAKKRSYVDHAGEEYAQEKMADAGGGGGRVGDDRGDGGKSRRWWRRRAVVLRLTVVDLMVIG
ncbi:hypothetical protein E3N88_05177 [Mikania micrantha]|uniref:Uncharacterized protein n=1 Tax=Mikania micrantha TaxID=192012 RepID=A0A5N6PWK9_9ASTR|nr:hypothetical protein E3N88_05177 [Mikania micrantha]